MSGGFAKAAGESGEVKAGSGDPARTRRSAPPRGGGKMR